nr:iron uptake system protein EfeO [uncultured Leptotrichia sp.]
MKKIGILLLLGALIAVSCGKNGETKDNGKADSSVSQQSQKNGKVDLSKETTEYKKFVEDQIDMLLKDTENFAQLLKEGKLEEAKKVYPLIRMSYERSEPIAESFGESDVNIDFRLVDFKEEKKTEEGWRGFHRIERILWEQNTTKGTEKYADQLVKDIKELKAKIATVEVTPDLMVTGAIDLLNEVSTSKITGEEEVYSHTDLYDFRANIEGAQKIFELFRPKLEKKDAKLVATLDSEFKAVNDLLNKYMTDDKHYKLYTELTKEDTKALAEAVTKLGEPLSQMGIIMDVSGK